MCIQFVDLNLIPVLPKYKLSGRAHAARVYAMCTTQSHRRRTRCGSGLLFPVFSSPGWKLCTFSRIYICVCVCVCTIGLSRLFVSTAFVRPYINRVGIVRDESLNAFHVMYFNGKHVAPAVRIDCIVICYIIQIRRTC